MLTVKMSFGGIQGKKVQDTVRPSEEQHAGLMTMFAGATGTVMAKC